ncbi:O-Antigen ligase [compost metagenome]
MIHSSTSSAKPAWFMNVVGLLLALGCSAMLIFFMKNGAPSRPALGFLIALLILTPVLLRWQVGWLMLFLIFPFISLIRRLYLLIDTNMGTGNANDFLVLLPDMLMGVVMVGFLLSIRNRKKGELNFNDRSLRVPLVLFIGLNIIEIFNPFMGSIAAGINGFRQFTLYILLYFLTQVVIERKDQLYRWLVATMVLGAVTGLYGAYQYIYGFPQWDTIWAKMYGAQGQVIGDSMRAFSTFSFTSTFSHYMVITACAALFAFRIRGIGILHRTLAPFYLVCMLMGLGLTFVRSSYMGLMVAGALGLIVAGKPEGRWKRMVALFVLAGVLVTVAPKGGQEITRMAEAEGAGELVATRITTLADPAKTGSMSARFNAWNNVLTNSIKYPAGVGLGAGSSYRITGNYTVSAFAYTESQHFSMLAELGWPGFILFIWINIAGFLLSLRVYDRLRNPDLKRMAGVSMMMQAGLTVAGLTGGTVLFTLPGSAFYWTALGIVTVLPRLDDPVPTEEA